MGFGMVYDLGFTAFCMSFSLQPGIGEGCHVNGQQPPEFTRKVTSHPSESTSHPPMSSRSPWKLHEKCQENHQRFPKCQTVQQFPHRNPWNTSPIPIVPGMTDESDLPRRVVRGHPAAGGPSQCSGDLRGWQATTGLVWTARALLPRLWAQLGDFGEQLGEFDVVIFFRWCWMVLVGDSWGEMIGRKCWWLWVISVFWAV